MICSRLLNTVYAMIETILRAPEHGAMLMPVECAHLSPDAGLEGDRYANRKAIVSLIEAEAVEAFNSATGLTISAADTGRNIVTRGIRLNAFEQQKRFHIGDAELEFFELCEPCATLGKRLATPEVSAADVVKAFTHRCGIRARVLKGADIAPGTEIA